MVKTKLTLKIISVMVAFSIIGLSLSLSVYALSKEMDSSDSYFAMPFEQVNKVPAGYVGIYNAKDFNKKIRENMNANYILMSDIDLSNYENWVPFGLENMDNTVTFFGTLDGNGYCITGFNSSGRQVDLDLSTCTAYSGLFGYVGGQIMNLGVSGNVSITDIKYEGSLIGSIALVQGLTAQITNCYSKVNIYAAPNIDVVAGGLVGMGMIDDCQGQRTPKLSYCRNYGRIACSSMGYIGGICGGLEIYSGSYEVATNSNYGDISVTCNEAEIDEMIRAGGITGYACNGISLKNCVNVGDITINITASETENDYIEACAAGIIADGTDASVSQINRCYNSGKISINTFGEKEFAAVTGGIIAIADKCSISNSYNSGIVSAKGTGDHDSIFVSGGIAGVINNDSDLFCLYNVGSVSASESLGVDSFAGGIAGAIGDIDLIARNCYYLCDNVHWAGFERNPDKSGIVKENITMLTEAQMRDIDNFVGFNTETTWTIGENGAYPYPELKAARHIKGTVKATDMIFDSAEYSVRVRGTINLDMTLYPENSDIKSITWMSSDVNVAQVNSNGQVTGIARGTAVISAITSDGQKVDIKVTVRFEWWQWLIQILLFGWIWY